MEICGEKTGKSILQITEIKYRHDKMAQKYR